GNVIHLFEHDCSLQRRHQKVVELAPASELTDEVRSKILEDAKKSASAVNYCNAGTAAFLVDQQGRHHFIEIKPRIQVEHTITEEITGIDIVAAQIQISAGATLADLGLTQDVITKRGYAIQCRVTTEDPAAGFQPDTSKIEVYHSTGGNGVGLDASSGFALPIHVHSHDTAGISLAKMLQCARSGADVVDCAIDSMSGMTSQCAMGALCAGLEQNGLGTGIRYDNVQVLNVCVPSLQFKFLNLFTDKSGPVSTALLVSMPNALQLFRC
ncbi:uncharacterized protein MELLADRAFT_39722, partial [Melampsora larici-populina 98AG31]